MGHGGWDSRRGRGGGVWPRLTDRRRSLGRQRAARKSHPPAASLESPRVKPTEPGGAARGEAAGKQVAGRTRHRRGEVLGRLRVGVVPAASLPDREGAQRGGERRAPCVLRGRGMWAAGGAAGTLGEGVARFRPRHPLRLELGKRAADVGGFGVRPKRWIGARTLGWLNPYRRLSKAYATLPATREAMIDLAMIRLMLARLTGTPL